MSTKFEKKKVKSSVPQKAKAPPQKAEQKDRVKKNKVVKMHGKHTFKQGKHPLLLMLKRNRGGGSVESKCMRPISGFRSKGEGDDIFIDEQTLSVARSLTDVSAVYEFKITRTFAVSSSVGGVVDFYTNNDPSSYTEWASLTALFSQVKLRRVELHFARAFATAIPTTTSVGSWYPAVYNVNYDDIGAPGSYSGCLDSPRFRVWNLPFDTRTSPVPIHLDFTGEHEPLWADTGSPASSTLYQGCPGCSQMYMSSVTPSTEVAYVTQSLYIMMMNRF